MEKAIDDFDKKLDDRLEELKVAIPDYEGIQHSEIVKRAMGKKKPFNESGKGYRDALLWESLVRYCSRFDTKTILITKNKKDFCDEKDFNSIHKDLKQDLIARNKNVELISICNSLEVFINEYIKPTLDKINIASSIEDNGLLFDFDLSLWIKDNHEKIKTYLQLNIESLMQILGEVSEFIHSPHINFMEFNEKYKVIDTYEYDDEKFIVNLRMPVELSLEFIIWRTDYNNIAEQFEVYISDVYKDEHFFEAQSFINTYCTLIVNYNKNENIIENFESKFS